MVQNIAQNREMIFLEGMGGLTDDIIAAKTSTQHSKTKIESMIKKARITVLPAAQPAADLVSIFCNRLLNNV